MPRATQPEPVSGSGFAWSVEAYDRQCAVSPHVAIRLIRRVQNQQDHAERGAALLSDAEIELEQLERQLAGRELRVRAADGDPDAVAGLVEEAARHELLIDTARDRAQARREARGLRR